MFSKPLKHDIFFCIRKLGKCAARIDWLTHAQGAHSLMGKKESPLQPANVEVSIVRHPSDICVSMQVFEVETKDGKGCRLIACPDEDVADEHKLTSKDVDAIHLDLPSFGKWVAKLLSLPARTSPKVSSDQSLISFEVQQGRVHISLTTEFHVLKQQLLALPDKQVQLVLTLGDWWEDSHVLDELLSSKTSLRVIPLEDFIRYNGREYEYAFHTPLVNFLNGESPEKPVSLFLPRPAGCGWEDLYIEIFTTSHYGVDEVQHDYIRAEYRDPGGRVLAKSKNLFVGSQKELFFRGKCVGIYALLKGYAAGQGMEHNLLEKTANSMNGDRKKLHAYLADLFGYPLADDPFVASKHKPPVFTSRFHISFSDTKSDPLAMGRGKARARLPE